MAGPPGFHLHLIPHKDESEIKQNGIQITSIEMRPEPTVPGKQKQVKKSEMS